jgi:hypothetical protein
MAVINDCALSKDGGFLPPGDFVLDFKYQILYILGRPFRNSGQRSFPVAA